MAKKRKTAQEAEQIARQRLGFDALRPAQRQAIEAIVEGRDTLSVQPTGSGKSAIYQIAGMMLDGPTVVISPLIALQRDQLDSIQSEDRIPDAGVINSTMRVAELRETFEKLENGDLEFLFLAPEQLSKEETVERLQAAKPSLFVVDEAHCISEWGHDFRPDYLKLGAAIESLGRPRILALTATASPEVREEIVRRLGMRDPRIIVAGFDRPNIWLSVETFKTEAEKRDALIARIEEAQKPGIVYVATRKHAEEIGSALADRGIPSLFYHGGMKASERHQIQEDFMQDRAGVLVATNAFGMGVDKPNVRFVFHYDVSDSIDSYYQEIGRAGRDGQPARAVLFFRPQDLSVRKFFKGGGKLDAAVIQQVAEKVLDQDRPVHVNQLNAELPVSERKLAKALNRLEEAGVLERDASGQVVASGTAPEDLAAASEQAAQAQAERKEWEQLRIEKMRLYAEMTDCRRAYLLNYFSDEAPARCEGCDNCATGRTGASAKVQQAQAAPAETPSKAGGTEPFPVKSRVAHKEWGKGIVENYDGDKINVVFDQIGRKTLSVQFVLDKELLERVA